MKAVNQKNKVLLVVNPVAGNADKQPLIEATKEESRNKGFHLEILETTGTKDEEAISNKITSHKPDRVLVAGGDGTLQLVANVIQERDIIMGILPAGSANGLSTNLRLPDSRKDQLAIALGENLIEMDTLVINDHICLHIADLGVNAHLIKNYEDSRIRGKWGYFLQTLPTLIQADYPYTFKVEANEYAVEDKGILIAIANAQMFGTGANINPTGKVNDGKFEVLIYKRLDIGQILKTIYDQADLDSDFVEMVCTNEVRITCDRKVPFQIDGEFLGEEDEIHAKMGTSKLRIAVPRAFTG